MQKVVLAQPKLLMKSPERLTADAQAVRRALKDSADTIIEQYPVGVGVVVLEHGGSWQGCHTLNHFMPADGVNTFMTPLWSPAHIHGTPSSLHGSSSWVQEPPFTHLLMRNVS
jgi:hypothetical protein